MIEFLFGFLVGWLLGRFIMRLILVRKAMRIIEARGGNMAADIGLEDTPKLIVPEMKVEAENGIMYLYDAASGKYFCQGDSLAELASRLKEIHHIRTLVIVNRGQEKFAFLDGEVA
jgi:hypothetical protein